MIGFNDRTNFYDFFKCFGFFLFCDGPEKGGYLLTTTNRNNVTNLDLGRAFFRGPNRRFGFSVSFM